MAHPGASVETAPTVDDPPLIEKLGDRAEFERIHGRLALLAWSRYRIPRAEAEDIAQTAIVTYCEVRGRYVDVENQTAILIGVFRKKCLEYIDRSVRELKKLRALAGRPDLLHRNPHLDPEGSGAARPVIDEIIRKEDADLILSTLKELRPEAREMLSLLVVDELGRQGLLEKYHLNENTLDSRLHVFRAELRKLLRRKGVLA